MKHGQGQPSAKGKEMSRLLKLILLILFTTACTGYVVPIMESPSATPSESLVIPNRMATPSFVVPTSTFAPTQTPSCVGVAGRMEQMEYTGQVNKDEIAVRIYLPPCYESSAERYPVLYLLHGYPMDESQWDELGIDELVETGIQAGRWQPFLMVMPNLPRSLNVETDGGPDSYEEEFLAGLMPFIDNNYRTSADAEHRAIAGISRGAIWALEIGFRNPDQIGIIAALSPALPMNQARPEYDPFDILQSASRLPSRIFISVGDEEMGFRTKTEEFVGLMKELGVPHDFLLTSGGHEATTWAGVMEDLIIFVTESWNPLAGSQ
jgi:enterochelin esterase-like enzyme